jgi:hypothetical protein
LNTYATAGVEAAESESGVELVAEDAELKRKERIIMLMIAKFRVKELEEGSEKVV